MITTQEETLLRQYLASIACPYKDIQKARFEGKGEERIVVAHVDLEDGSAMICEMFQWGPGCLGNRWKETQQALEF